MNAISLITITQGGAGKWTVHALAHDGKTLERRVVEQEGNVAACVDLFIRSAASIAEGKSRKE